jgi:hypothetical protein
MLVEHQWMLYGSSVVVVIVEAEEQMVRMVVPVPSDDKHIIATKLTGS